MEALACGGLCYSRVTTSKHDFNYRIYMRSLVLLTYLRRPLTSTCMEDALLVRLLQAYKETTSSHWLVHGSADDRQGRHASRRSYLAKSSSTRGGYGSRTALDAACPSSAARKTCDGSHVRCLTYSTAAARWHPSTFAHETAKQEAREELQDRTGQMM